MNFHLLDSHFNSSITSLVSNSANSEFDSMNQSYHSHTTQSQHHQRKLTNSIIPLTIKNIRSARRAVKSEIIPKVTKKIKPIARSFNSILDFFIVFSSGFSNK